MKTPRILARVPASLIPSASSALGIASLMLAPLAARAVTDTWDGGGANNNLNTSANWVDGSAPASDLVNTDLIFAGGVRLAPNMSAAFSTHRVTFNNTAGAFTIGGLTLSVGTGGIDNKDAQTMAFTNVVSFSGVANATINAFAGGLTFTNTVSLPTSTLTVTGGFATSFGNFSKNTAVMKQGGGVMTWSPNADIEQEMTIADGTLNMGADGSADVFSSSSAIAVAGTSILNINESLTLDGAQLTRSSGGDVNLAAGKTLAVQNGGDAVITGAFTNNTASTIVVAGAGSTFSTTSTLALVGGSTTSVLAGGAISTAGGAVGIGTNGNGTATVSGSGSSMSGGNLNVGLNGVTGTLTFSSGSTGAFTGIRVDASIIAGTTGTMNIQSGAGVTGTSLAIATGNAATTGTINLNSVLTLNGAATANIGAASASTGALNVNSGGIFNSGTGLTTVHPTGLVSINDGTYNSRGDLTINGGRLTRNATGDFNVGAGTTLSLQAGGVVQIIGEFSHNNFGSRIIVTGSGFSTTSRLTFDGGSTTNVSAGGVITTGAFEGSFGGSVDVKDATVTVTGIGSFLNAANLYVAPGLLIFSNSSLGRFADIEVYGNPETSGNINIQSGAAVIGEDLEIAADFTGLPGAVTITGANSMLTLVSAGFGRDVTANIGSASNGTGTLNVNGSGTFNIGTGLTTVNATGTIAINGGTYNSNGDLTLNGGRLTRDAAGVFALAAAQTLTVQAGGDATITGAFSNNTASSIIVTGPGSTFTTTGDFLVDGDSTLGIFLGADVSSGSGILRIATSGAGAVTVNGAGSSLTSGGTVLAQSGNSGSLTFSNGSTGTLGTISVDESSPGTSGILAIQSGATVTGSGLAVASIAAGNTGSVTITGAGSALTLTGAATATIGAASASIGTLTVENGGTFTTGTGLTTVKATGDLNVNAGGTMIVRGNMVVHGSLDIAGTVILGESAMAAPPSSEFSEAECTAPGGLGMDGTIAQVPEPGSVTLLAFGALSLLARRHRFATVRDSGACG